MTNNHAVTELTHMLHQLRRREARRRGGEELTYRELAARTGWSLGIIAQYFSGKSLPPVGRFDVLIRLLGATPAEQGILATQRDRADEQRRVRIPLPVRNSEIRLLGPVEVIGPQGAATLVGVRQRALLGLLALEAGRVVTQSRLLDALWGQQPPRTAVQTLYSHIARVRHCLDACGLPGLLVTRRAGYALMVTPDEVDVIRFERGVASARRSLANGSLSNVVNSLVEALTLWRGDALADALPTGWIAAEVDRLHEMRLHAQEVMWDARLRLGEHAAAIDELDKLLVTHPGRERLVELFMTALYRCGRHTDALDAYQRLRGHLADHLGVAPGPALAQLYTAVLQRHPDLDLEVCSQPSSAKPAQLPSRVGHFVGRAADLSVLNGLLATSASVGRLGVVRGPAGMGKTALAVQWAHSVIGKYPDGQLFLDLRGHDPDTAMPLAETLTHLLRGLGVPMAQLPADPDGMKGLYRSVLHGKRVLILLDNAATADTLIPLVPPSAGSLLLVTSRNQLAGLTVDYAVTGVDLDVLPPAEALELLGRVLGADRVAGEAIAAGELIESCGRMPLALRIAGAKLAVRPMQTIAELAEALAGADRLDTLAVPGDSRSIRAVFASAYQALSPDAACMFRRLGLFPGICFSPMLAATLIGVSYADGRRILEELADVHLIASVGTGWYRFHDLIRLYAAEQTHPEELAGTAQAIADWYLCVADAANSLFDPARDRAGQLTTNAQVEAPFPSDHDSASAFLDGELSNLAPVVRFVADNGLDRAAWQLTYLLTSFNMLRGHKAEQVELCRIGLFAADRLADPAARALMHSLLGMALNTTQQHAQALDQLQQALTLMRLIGDKRGQGMALNNIALAHGRLGKLEAASEAFGQALDLHTADGHLPGVALALNNLGHACTLMGKTDLALDHLTRALTLAQEIGNPHLEAMTLNSLGEAHLAVADHTEALADFQAAWAIRRRTGERRKEAETLNLIGLTHRRCGEHAAAATHFRQALALSRELRDRHLEAVTLAHLSNHPDGDDRGAVGDRTR